MTKKPSILSRILSHALILINLGAVCWLGLCYIASITPPYEIRHLALFSLTTPFAIAANIGLVLFWLFSRKKIRTLLSLIPLALCASMIPAVFGMNYFSKNDWNKGENRFKLMSWNVHAMGLFNPRETKKHAAGIVQLIKEENPDILCLPEISRNNEAKDNAYIRKIINDGNYTEFRYNSDNEYNSKISLGVAVFSRFPIVSYKVYPISQYIFLIQNDVVMPANDTLRLFVVHMESFRLTDKDKAIIEGMKKNKGEDLAQSRSFIWKFNDAYNRRAHEADSAHGIINQSPYPTIICGDFNDLPYSYTYCTMKGELSDAFVKKGRGFGRTYNQIIPTLRIDHIFYDDNALHILAFDNPFSPWSDHSPVIANFEIKPKATR